MIPEPEYTGSYRYCNNISDIIWAGYLHVGISRSDISEATKIPKDTLLRWVNNCSACTEKNALAVYDFIYSKYELKIPLGEASYDQLVRMLGRLGYRARIWRR